MNSSRQIHERCSKHGSVFVLTYSSTGLLDNLPSVIDSWALLLFLCHKNIDTILDTCGYVVVMSPTGETSVASARSHVAFEEMLPTILNALHDIELDRVSYFKHAIGHAATGMVTQVWCACGQACLYDALSCGQM